MKAIIKNRESDTYTQHSTYSLLNIRKISVVVLGLMFVLLLMPSCKDGGKIQYYPTVEEMNRGSLKIQCDESLKGIMLQQSEIFELNFPEAKISFEFLPEQVILENLLSGNIRTAVISRKLNSAELKKIESLHNVKPRENTTAKNAIAMIVSKTNIETTIKIDELKKLLEDGSKTLVVEGKQSFMAKSIFDALGMQIATTNLSALNSADSVVNYVKNNSNAIGFISFSTISDVYSPQTKEILSGVSVVQIQLEKDGELLTTSANQSDLYLDDYPLIVPVNYIVTDFKDKLSIGFVNYLFRAKAGRVFVHAGLIPSVMPEREIVIDPNPVPNAK